MTSSAEVAARSASVIGGRSSIRWRAPAAAASARALSVGRASPAGQCRLSSINTPGVRGAGFIGGFLAAGQGVCGFVRKLSSRLRLRLCTEYLCTVNNGWLYSGHTGSEEQFRIRKQSGRKLT